MTVISRLAYVDSNASKFANYQLYLDWRTIVFAIEQYGADAGPLTAKLNLEWQKKLVLDYVFYSNLYNIIIGATWDTNGNDSQMYITNEDYADHLVDMHLYDVSTYEGEVGDFSLMLDGPAGLKTAIVSAIKSTIEFKGSTVRSIDIMETTTRQVWGFPIYSNYAVRVFWHGSPLIPGLAALIVYAIVAALFLIGVTVAIWQITKTQQIGQVTKQVSTVEDTNKALLDIYNNPNTTPSDKEKILEAITKSQIEVSKTVGVVPKVSDKGAFSDVAEIIKWVARYIPPKPD